MKSYYDIANNEYSYLLKTYEAADLDYFNPIVVQCQQIIEKLLKHIIQNYCLNKDYSEILRSHKLLTLYNTILSNFPDFILDLPELREIGDFYFDVRYPSVDYTEVTKEVAYNVVRNTSTIKNEVDKLIERLESNKVN